MHSSVNKLYKCYVHCWKKLILHSTWCPQITIPRISDIRAEDMLEEMRYWSWEVVATTLNILE